MPIATYRKIEEYASRGGYVIAVKSPPSLAPGFVELSRDSDRHRPNFAGSLCTRCKDVQDSSPARSDLGAAIGALLKPDVAISPATPTVGFIHRKLPDADIYFLANTDNRPHAFDATFRTTKAAVELWNPFTGKSTNAGTSSKLNMHLAPYESRVVVFSDQPCTGAASSPRQKNSRPST